MKLTDNLPNWIAWPLRLVLYAFVLSVLVIIALGFVNGKVMSNATECNNVISGVEPGLKHAKVMVTCLRTKNGILENWMSRSVYRAIEALPNSPGEFVGTWDAYQPGCTYRHKLEANGEFVSESNGCPGKFALYSPFHGAWGVYDNQMIWLSDEVIVWPPEINPIDAVDKDFFFLVEKDGTRTKFTRVNDTLSSLAITSASPQLGEARIEQKDEINSNRCVAPGGCMKWDTIIRQDALKKLNQVKFTQVKIKTLSELHNFVSQVRFDEVIKILKECSCDQGEISIYHKEGNHKQIIMAQDRAGSIYPKVISVNDTRTKEIKLAYGFMYDTGTISAITDINNNGYVEFWLEGTINECEEGCGEGDGNGIAIIEETEDLYCVRAEPNDFKDLTAGYVDGKGTTALFNTPNGITSDGINLYVADTLNNKIRKVETATGVVTTLAGSDATCPVDGAGKVASFNGPQGIVATGGNLYVTDTLNNKIRKVEIATGLVTTIAGSGNSGAADGAGMAASFNQPFGITTDGNNIYVTDSTNNKIRKIEIATRMVTTLAGSGRFDHQLAGAGTRDGCDDGIGKAASFCHPTGITIFDGNLYVVDQGNPRIRKVNIGTGAVTTLAGSGRYGDDDGTASAALFSGGTGISNDGHNLFVADGINYIRKIVTASGAVSTLPKDNAPCKSLVWGIVVNNTDLYATTGCNTIQKIEIPNNKATTLTGHEPVPNRVNRDSGESEQDEAEQEK